MHLHLFSHTSDDCPEGRRTGIEPELRPNLGLSDLLYKTIGNRCLNHHHIKTNRKTDQTNDQPPSKTNPIKMNTNTKVLLF